METCTFFKEDFSDGVNRKYWSLETASEHSLKIQDPNVPKPCWIRLELRKDDPIVNNSKRAEIALNDFRESNHEIRYYGLTTFLPDSPEEKYEADVVNGVVVGSELIFQWHNVPDNIGGKQEEWTIPSLYVKTYGDKYLVGGVWDDGVFSSNEQMIREGKVWQTEMESFLPDLGKVVEWRIELKWGWLPEHKPYIKIFKNNVLWFERIGANTTNDKMQPIFKVGIYKWDWAQLSTDSVLDRRVIYYSNIFAG